MENERKLPDSYREDISYAKLATSDTGIVKVLREKGSSRRERFNRHSERSEFYNGGKSRQSTGSSHTAPKLLKFTRVTESPDSGLGTSTEEPDGLNFDLLFESPDKYPLGLRTPKRISPSSSLDDPTCRDIETGKSNVNLEDVGRTNSEQHVTPSTHKLSRVSSLADTSLTQLLVKHFEHSRGFVGFRRRVANDISQKYCSFCRCDEVIFLFLYVVFGIVYVSAGTLGVLHCPEETKIALFLLIDGILSIFIFPITIVEWTKRIGGCVHETQKLDRGIFFIIVLVMRIMVAIAGTAILVLRAQEPPEDELICFSVHVLLEVGVLMEWGFLLFVILLPLMMFCCAFITVKTIV